MGGRLIVLGGLLGMIVVLAAGCGGKKSASPPTTTTAATTSAATTTAAPPTTTSSSGTTGKPSFASTKNCRQLESLAQQAAASLNVSNGKADPSKVAQVIEALAAAAPSDIRGDLKTFADAYSAFVKAYTASGFKPGTVPTAAQIAKFSAAAKTLSTPKVEAAEQHLAAWGQKNCGG